KVEELGGKREHLRHDRLDLAEDAAEPRAGVTDLEIRWACDLAAERLADRRESAVQREGRSGPVDPAVGRPGDPVAQVAGEPRLADSGVAFDHHDLAVALARSPAPAVPQQLALL